VYLPIYEAKTCQKAKQTVIASTTPASQNSKPKTTRASPSKNSTQTSNPDDYDGKEWEKKAEFKEIINSFVKKHTWNDGIVRRHCRHCASNNKSTKIIKSNGDPALLECGCSKDKGVCEELLLKRGILGNDFEEKELSSLSSKEWFMVNYIMGELFGFNTNWLMDKEVMIAGLTAKLAELKE
jgi:hypothetical protein